MTDLVTMDAVRVPAPARYSMHIGVDSIYLRCNTCHEHKLSSSESGKGWIFAFESKGLPEILNAVIRHEEAKH